MPYEFKSSATNSLIVDDEVYAKMEPIIRRETDRMGVITVMEIPGVMLKLRAAAAREEREGGETKNWDDPRIEAFIQMLKTALYARDSVILNA
ncbi:MAG: DUF1840 family protein [Hydrogenophaga sp.]|nr:DUF1840 family protein [Hydrogenophaga sp.]